MDNDGRFFLGDESGGVRAYVVWLEKFGVYELQTEHRNDSVWLTPNMLRALFAYAAERGESVI